MPEASHTHGTFNFSARHIGRNISDTDWDTLNPIHLDLWRKLSQFANNISCEFNNNIYVLNFDFSEPISYLEDLFGRYKKIYEDKDSEAFAGLKKSEVTIPVSAYKKDCNEPITDAASHIVEYYIYNFFLIMNLSSPGCCNFHGSTLSKIPPDKKWDGSELSREIDLSGGSFEAAYYVKEKYGWLELHNIPFSDVVEWMKLTLPSFKMIPENKSSKCLFSLLHIVKSGDFGATTIVWIFHALETLYDCKPGENFSTLLRRISLLLNLNSNEKNQLKKKLRELYDVRSAFVHGGLEVVHPMRNEFLDKRADDAAWRHMPLADFGTALLIKSIQQVIVKKSTGPIFEESMIWDSSRITS